MYRSTRLLEAWTKREQGADPFHANFVQKGLGELVGCECELKW